MSFEVSSFSCQLIDIEMICKNEFEVILIFYKLSKLWFFSGIITFLGRKIIDTLQMLIRKDCFHAKKRLSLRITTLFNADYSLDRRLSFMCHFTLHPVLVG